MRLHAGPIHNNNGLCFVFFQLADVICFDIGRQQVDSASDMAFTEVVTLTQVDNNGFFFVDKTRRFTTGNDFNL